METQTKNWAAWYDNEPLYKEGDIIVYKDGVLQNVGLVKKIKVDKIGDSQKDATEKRISEQRICCGGKIGRGIRQRLNSISYNVDDGDNGIFVYEGEIVGEGIAAVNNLIRDMKSESDDYSEKLYNAGKALGYNNDY